MAKADEPTSGIYMVLESFGTEINGSPVTYVKGETIDADHPHVKRWPKFFGPLVVTHPAPARRSTLRAPEVRAD